MRPYRNRKERKLRAPRRKSITHEEKLQYMRDYYHRNKTRLAKVKADRRKHDLDYRLRAVLRTIVQRCEDPWHTSYDWYGARGIKNFLSLDDLKTLWIRDGAAKMKRPSIDREHRDDHYEFAKCKFVELADNVRRGVEYRESKKSSPNPTTMRA